MNDAFGVHPAQCLHDRQQVTVSLLNRDRPPAFLHDLLQRFAFHIFHGKIGRSVFFKVPVNIDDMLISDKLGQSARFTQELLLAALIFFRTVFRIHLQGTCSVCPSCYFSRQVFLNRDTGPGCLVHSDIGDSETALSQNSANLISASQNCTGNQRQRILSFFQSRFIAAERALFLLMDFSKTIITNTHLSAYSLSCRFPDLFCFFKRGE